MKKDKFERGFDINQILPSKGCLGMIAARPAFGKSTVFNDVINSYCAKSFDNKSLIFETEYFSEPIENHPNIRLLGRGLGGFLQNLEQAIEKFQPSLVGIDQIDMVGYQDMPCFYKDLKQMAEKNNIRIILTSMSKRHKISGQQYLRQTSTNLDFFEKVSMITSSFTDYSNKRFICCVRTLSGSEIVEKTFQIGNSRFFWNIDDEPTKGDIYV